MASEERRQCVTDNLDSLPWSARRSFSDEVCVLKFALQSASSSSLPGHSPSGDPFPALIRANDRGNTEEVTLLKAQLKVSAVLCERAFCGPENKEKPEDISPSPPSAVRVRVPTVTRHSWSNCTVCLLQTVCMQRRKLNLQWVVDNELVLFWSWNHFSHLLRELCSLWASAVRPAHVSVNQCLERAL